MDGDICDASFQDMGLCSRNCRSARRGRACFGPQPSNDYYDRGVARFKEDKYKGAVADFSQAISIRPKYTAAYIGRGDARIGLGLYEEAIADFDQALQLQPDASSDVY